MKHGSCAIASLSQQCILDLVMSVFEALDYVSGLLATKVWLVMYYSILWITGNRRITCHDDLTDISKQQTM